MSNFNKIAWLESQYLYPHHFQQQERYFENLIEQRCKSINPLAFGFKELSINTAWLSDYKIGLKSANGVFPDGCTFDFPILDELPPPLEIKESIRNSIVYLAIPLYQSGSCFINITGNHSQQEEARYKLHELDVYDYSREDRNIEKIETATLQCKLVLENDDLSNYSYLPVLKISEISQTDGIILDESFIPPIVDYKASLFLQQNLQHCLSIVTQRAEALAERFTAQQQSNNAIADFLLLQLLNKHEPVLANFIKLEHCHPLSVYQQLAEFLGELATFCSKNKRPHHIESYKHRDLGSSFLGLFKQIIIYLNSVLEQSAVQIPIEHKQYGICVTKIHNPELYQNSRLILAVKSSLEQELFKDYFSAHFKLGTVENISHLVNNHLMGLPIKFLNDIPREISHQSGFIYFEIQIQHQQLDELTQSSGLAFHIAAQIDDLEVILWSIRQ